MALLLLGGTSLLPAAAPASGIDSAALERLVAEAEKEKSNALFVFENERPVRALFFRSRDTKVNIFSVTKLFTGLAVGLLYDKGLIASPEEPLVKFYPELAADPLKARLTLRHLLQHSSGIFTTPGSNDIYPQKDFVKFALTSPMVAPPGEQFQYNNRAINIVSGVVRALTGQSMERFLRENLLRPLGITDYEFLADSAGNTWAMDRLMLKASDMIKVGSLLANGGRWQGRQIISERWLQQMFQGSLASLGEKTPWGLSVSVWDFRGRFSMPAEAVERLSASGAPDAIVQKLRTFAGSAFGTREEFSAALRQILTPAEIETISAIASRGMFALYETGGALRMIGHSGEIGEYIIALPQHGVAVVRTIDWERGSDHQHGFSNLWGRTAELVLKRHQEEMSRRLGERKAP